MKFADIGQQLRAYRMESGMRAEEIAARLGVSRAALYRYEKGEVIKLETIRRLAELLKVSPLALLGIGIEYFTRPAAFQERLRGIEEGSDQILQVGGAYCYPLASDAFEAVLAEAWAAAVPEGNERAAALAQGDQALGVLAFRRRTYAQKRPTIIAVLGEAAVAAFLDGGIAAGLDLPAPLRARARDAARQEVLALATLMDAMPLGLQIGLARGLQPAAPFMLIRGRERAHVVTSPLSPELLPQAAVGVAGITAADEAVVAHQRIAEAVWRDAAKGADAAEHLRSLVREAALRS
ncbi:helix-turn-helix domain-containing protein [Roseococcus sp. DSY-14]|uniref:helix-turn-helix domain-containing protein n=1 Tax=Roseococcus sp. DSY-14 TaxID=3369650 RepID=UPI00387B69F8